MVKILNILLLQNQESFGAESWYVALRAQDQPSCSNDDRRLNFDFFYGKVEFASLFINILKSHFLSMY